MHPTDVFILVLFAAYAVSAGLRNRARASRNLEEYFLAGRSLPGWKAGLSMAATQFAADTPLLVTGLIATAGVFALWQLWVYALAFLLMGFVLGAGWRRAGVLTDAELTEVRYSRGPATVLRAIKAVYFGTIINCTVLAFVLFAAARIAQPFLVWNEWLPAGVFAPVAASVEWVGIPVAIETPDDPDVWVHTANNLISIVAILLLSAFYSTTGGLRSVVATDVVQICVMFAGTAAFTTIVVQEVGGLDAIPDLLNSRFEAGGIGGISPGELLAFTPDHAHDASAFVLLLFGLQWLIQMNSDGTGYLAQRLMACRTDRDATTAAVVFTFTQVLLRSLLWLPLGLGLLLIFPPDLGLPAAAQQAEREATYVRGMAELLPPGVRGLMLTGMLAALASTVDTHLNWGSSYWTNDIYRRFICQLWLKREPGERSLVWVARGANLVILGLALLIMTQLSSINQAWQTSLLLGAGVGIVLILRWVWWRTNVWAEIAALGVSIIVAPLLMVVVDDEHHALRLLLAAAVSTVAALFAIWVAGPEPRDRLDAFYRKVHPVGIWGPVAERQEHPQPPGLKRLARSLGATALAALSVFCLLVGVGSWLIGSPGPSWFPRAAWIVTLTGVGLALCPVWYRLGYDRR